MTNQRALKIELALLLPEVEDERDPCIARLRERMAGSRGIAKAHLQRRDNQATLCLHYDPNLVSLNQVRRLAESAGSDLSDRYRHEIVRLRGMDCADCAASIEHILGRLDGVVTVSVSYAAERMRIEYDSKATSREAILRRIAWMGYHVDEEELAGWVREHRELLLSGISGFFLAAGFFGESFFGLPTPAALACFAVAYLAGGYDATRHGVKAALKLRFDIDFLMVVAAVGAAVLGQWAEGALLLFLFSLGHALEHFATGKARRAIEALGKISPKTARVRRKGRESELAVEELQRGDTVIVRPGEGIPIDGKVTEGYSAVDQSPITGESVPVEKQTGDSVFAGTLNGEGALEIEVTKLARDTTLARVVQMVEEAQTQKSPTQRFTEKFEHFFVPLVLVSVLLVLLLPPLVGWLTWSVAFLRGMTILVAASPCALAIATPSAVLSAVAQAARNGVLIKGGVHLENLGGLAAMAFDKTGTITRGEPEITDLILLQSKSEQELLRTAAAVESRSGHPLAEAVLREARQRKLDLPDAGPLQAVPGRGVRAQLDRSLVEIGNVKMLSEDAASPIPDEVVERVRELEAEGKTTMIVKRDEVFLGILALADRPRGEAKETLQRLKRMGIRAAVMLTGDNPRVAAAIAEEVGLTQYKAGLLPDEKVAAIQDLLREHTSVAMVGDGVNDAPALTSATVGIAMGASGADVALETADIALMADNLSKLPFAVALSRQSRHIIRQNVLISLAVIAGLIPSALFGLAGIGVAIVFHEGSTLLVVANALRLLRFRV